MCTKFLGDGLCCGWDCYEITPDEPVEADLGAYMDFLDEMDDVWWGPYWWTEYPDTESFWHNGELYHTIQ